MTNETPNTFRTVNIAEVEREARRLRAQAFARGLHNFRVWLTRLGASAGHRTA